MKIGDVSTAGALFRPSQTSQAGAGFVRNLASVQRAYAERRPARLYEVSDRQEREREFNVRRNRLEDAALKLRDSAPRGSLGSLIEEQVVGVDRVATSREVTTETTVEQDATPASQTSVAFASADEIVAGFKSKLNLKLASGPQINIQVGALGASLQDLADAINQDPSNQGRVDAQVTSTPEGFRLQIATTDTGSDAVLDVKKDDFKTPLGDKYTLVDANLAVAGQDATSETTSTTETVEGSRRVLHTQEVEIQQQLDDEEFAGVVEEFVAAFNGLRNFVDDENFDVGDGFGMIGSDDRVRAVTEGIQTVDRTAEDRVSSNGSALADIGIVRDDSGRLSVDPEALQQALERDPTSVVELLNGNDEGLGQAVLDQLAAPPGEPAQTNFSLVGFLGGLSSREAQLSDEARALETVVQGLSQAEAASPAK